jgi:hypothetical protein
VQLNATSNHPDLSLIMLHDIWTHFGRDIFLASEVMTKFIQMYVKCVYHTGPVTGL